MENLQPGQDLGPYRIIGQIGQGGMATVYKAYHAAMDRYVAIKVLPHQLADNAEFAGRFQQEARTIARLEHARILPVYDSGTGAGLPYLVMRYLEAGTLKERMQAGLLSLAEVDRLFTQLAEALEYAHRQGVIHRDLKPSNAMLDAQGNLFLTDFGIAKLLEGGAQFTNTGAMMGTPAYMSPEQAQGDKVDQRTDIYSLGIILYELTTGRVPFEAETPLAVVLKQINSPLPPPSSIKPDLAPGIERVLLKALAKEPADRFASVADFLAAWKQALAGAETLAAPRPASPATVVAAAAPATLAAAPPPVSEAGAVGGQAAARPFPLAAVLGGVAVVVVLGILFAVFAPGLLAPAATATPAQSPAATRPSSLPAEEPAVTAAAATGEPAAGDPVWDSWTAANRVRRFFIQGNDLYAAGPGGITVWNLAEGAVQRRYTTGDGLPHVNVFSVWVDEDGTLWAATESGLGRLNPGSGDWITYDTADGLDSNLVLAVVRAGEFLVVGTAYSSREGGGLNLFDGRAWQAFPGFPSANSDIALTEGRLGNAVNVLLPAPDGVLWVGTEAGLGRYQRDTETWTRFTTADGLPGDRIFSLFLDSGGQLAVGTNGGAALFDGERFVPTDQAPPDSVLGIVQDAQGRYYLSGGGGIWRYDPANVNWEEFSSQTGDLPVYETTGSIAAEDGALFFGTDGVGPLYYNGQAFTPWYIDDSTVAAAHGRILPAPDLGELWFIEIYGAYTDRFDLQNEVWRPWTESPCDCTPLALDEQGNVWGSRWSQGFVIRTPEGALTEVGAAAGLPAEINVRGLAPLADGTAWIGTEDDGLAFYDGENVTWVDEAEGGPPRARVFALFLASDGALWTGVGDQISRRSPDGEWEHFRRGEALDGNFGFAADFAEDEDGGIWVATQGAGVNVYQDEAWTQYVDGQAGVQLPSNYLNAVTLDPDGSLWFGTAAGAARFDGSDWTTYAVRDGLIQAEVFDVYVEPDGVVWFATGGGVTRLQP